MKIKELQTTRMRMQAIHNKRPKQAMDAIAAIHGSPWQLLEAQRSQVLSHAITKCLLTVNRSCAVLMQRCHGYVVLW